MPSANSSHSEPVGHNLQPKRGIWDRLLRLSGWAAGCFLALIGLILLIIPGSYPEKLTALGLMLAGAVALPPCSQRLASKVPALGGGIAPLIAALLLVVATMFIGAGAAAIQSSLDPVATAEREQRRQARHQQREIDERRRRAEAQAAARQAVAERQIVGDAQVLPNDALLPVRTVREEITVDAILRNFIRRTPVEQPLAYFRQVGHEAGYTLPIFYYLHSAGTNRKEAVAALRGSKVAKPKSRDEITKLLNGRRSLYQKLGGRRLPMFNRIVESPPSEITSLKQAKDVCSALTGMKDAHSASFDAFHAVLGKCLDLWDQSDGDRDLLGYIRRAAARLDEVEYGPKVEKGN